MIKEVWKVRGNKLIRIIRVVAMLVFTFLRRWSSYDVSAPACDKEARSQVRISDQSTLCFLLSNNTEDIKRASSRIKSHFSEDLQN
jgi:hypothetical protein